MSEAKDIAESIYTLGAAMIRDFAKDERRSIFGASSSKYETRSRHEIEFAADRIQSLVERNRWDEAERHRATIDALRAANDALRAQLAAHTLPEGGT